MSESMSIPWIRDYFIDVAETHGAQLFNTPASSQKPKKVQLTDFLTYQENSYVWAWISDKNHRVSVRISQDAVDLYNSLAKRSIIDCRFFIVSISEFRPMFSPRPLGPKATGNTPVSHLSLEVGHVKLVGVGAHRFGNPGDLESDGDINEWVLGLRQDGGGGNVLKLRKQHASMQTRQPSLPPPPPLPPPPFSLHAPAPQCPAIKLAEDNARTNPERPQDLKHVYNKRWKIFEANAWKYAMKPVAEDRPESHPTSPPRTPLPTKRQGTPTDWSPSDRGTPAAPDKATVLALMDSSPRCDPPNVLTTAPSVDIAMSSDSHSLQPPTPAQRIKGSPPSRSIPHPRNSVEAIASHHPSQHLPASSPPPPSSSIPLPSSPLPAPAPMNIRKNIQRKVPHPGLPVDHPTTTNNGPAQILVPNSDTSGAGSSQSYLHSQPQSQHFQLPSSLTNSFMPAGASTPRKREPSNSSIRTPRMFAESSPRINVEEQETALQEQKHSTHKPEADRGKQDKSDSPNTSRPKVFEVGTSDTEEETEQCRVARTTARTQDGVLVGRDDGILEDDRLPSVVPSAVQRSPPRRPSPHPAASIICPSPSDRNTDEVPIHRVPQSPDRPMSRNSMHSLFSDSLDSSRAPVGQTGAKLQEKVTPAHVLKHDPETWKEPSFLARRKGKGKALAAEGPDTPSTSKKCGRSVESRSPVPKRAKVAASEKPRVGLGQAGGKERRQITGVSASKSIRSSNESTGNIERTTPQTHVQSSSKPRLATFVVDFESVNFGKGAPVPIVPEVADSLLRTGRIRKLGNDVKQDGRIYIMK